MKKTILSHGLLTVGIIALSAGCTGERTYSQSETPPTDEDIAVLSTALSHFDDADFHVEIRHRLDSPPTNRTMIVISDHSNTNTDFIDDPSIDQATEHSGRKMSKYMKREIQRRNKLSVSLRALQDEHHAFILAPDAQLNWWGMEFQESFPNAKAYVKPWLPAYDRRRVSALVIFSFGPRHHATVATYLLRKRDGRWEIEWHDFAYYI